MNIVRPKARSGVADQLVRSIHEGIRQGEFVPGQRLAEADLVLRFGVSRPVVREALRELASAGIVDVELYRGARVHQFSRDECGQIYAVRENLEALAARLCAENINQKGRQRLGALMKNMKMSAQKKDVSAYLEHNLIFHGFIAEISGNHYLEQLLLQLQLPLFRLIYGRLIDGEEVLRSLDEHVAVADAILERKPKQAEAKMRKHIHIAGARLLGVESRFFRA